MERDPEKARALDNEWPWLGTQRFWLVAAAVVVAAFMALGVMTWRVSRAAALVPIVTLSGPREAGRGETVRYAVLVRDQHGAAIPRASVRVGFWKNGLVELGRALTGDGGDASIAVRFPMDFAEARSMVAVAEVGVLDGTDDFIVQPTTPGRGATFVSTDKPLYQPGQTVHLRALAMAGEKPLADVPTVIEIRTADGIKVFRADNRTSAFGIASADFVLADQVKLGNYGISVTSSVPSPDANKGPVLVTGERSFEVKRYSLPKLKISLEDVSSFTADGPLRGIARASWIFGEPVTKGAISVTLERGGVLRSAAGQPDRDGSFHFVLAPQQKKPTTLARGSFTLRAKVEVEGGMRAEATKPVATLGSGEVRLEAFPESGVLVAGVKQTVYVIATHENKAGITVRQGDHGPEVKTSERGIAAVSVLPVREVSASGTVQHPSAKIVAYADDGSEGKLEISTTDDALIVRPSLPAYNAGEPMRVTVLGASVGERVALRMTKGSEPVAAGACVVEDAARGCETTLDLPVGTSGLVWAHAMSLPKPIVEAEVPARQAGRVRSGKRLIMVAGGSRDLDLRVTPDKKIYAPRDVGSVDVAVTGAGGSGVKAQLGVGVADEAVFLLANVRPDLEKNFFTVDKDLARARRPYSGGYDSSYRSSRGSRFEAAPGAAGAREQSVPASYEPSEAYDASTPPEVKAAILAALTTMPEPGGFENASTSAVASLAAASVSGRQSRLAAWAILLLTAVAVAAFAAFGLYGATRLVRGGLSPGLAPGARAGEGAVAPTGGATVDPTSLRLETRGLVIDWLAAVIAPPVLGTLVAAVNSALSRRGGEEQIVGAWLVLAPFCAVLLLRAVLRLRRTLAAGGVPALRRALVFLPFACFVGHLAVVLVLADRGNRLQLVFGFREDALFVPALIALVAQITFGLISVVRQTMLRDVSPGGRLWLLASRASFLGLPITLICLVALAATHVKHARAVGWTDFGVEERDTEYASESSSDNKEGGTGTRAKGEEGSMGNPNAPAPGVARAAAASSGKADEAAKGGARPLVVREYFPETLLWAPEVITDDAGRASVKVPFADSITTWRFGLRAVSAAGQLGSTTIPLVVKQDFFVEAVFPPVLTQGDEISVPVTVFSYTQEAQEVTLALQGDGVEVAGDARTVLHVGPREARGFRFTIRAQKAGERAVRLTATSPARGDAIERKISVTPNGLAVVRTINGRLTGAATANVELPRAAIDGGNDLYVKIYGGPLSQVSEGLDGVFRMPHGCFEQTSSTTYPSVLALDFLTRTKGVSPAIEKKARDYIGVGYQQLVSFEVPGGGFSLYGRAPALTTLTAYGLMEFADMARVSHVDDGLLERTRDWLIGKRTRSGGWVKPTYDGKVDPDEKDDVLVTAFAAWALAASSPKPAQDARLGTVLDLVAKTTLPHADDPYALALRANALFAGGRSEDARALLDRLAPLAIRGDDGVHFTSKATGVMYSHGSSLDVEVTGLATHAFALAGVQPELRAGALDWIVARRNSYGTWSTTQATVAAMRALLDEAKPAPKEPQDIAVLVDGEPTESFTMEPKARDVHRLVSLRGFSTTGKHAVELRATGAGDVSYQLVAAHYLPWQRGQGAGLSLDVAYAPSAVPAGAVTSCRVHLGWKGAEPARMPLVEIGVPPAFEVETDDLEALVRVSKSPVQRYSVERGKVTLYLVTLAEDKPLAFDLRLRALRPAHVVAPSSTAYLCYEPEVRTETAPVRVRAL